MITDVASLRMTQYDFNGQWSQSTGPNAPLYNCGGYYSVDSAVQGWIQARFPAYKILLFVYRVMIRICSAMLS